jgi:tRNA pseudouridine38-40 synthase
MQRYFLEVSYLGTQYSGFQIQKNASSVQAEVEKALRVYFHWNTQEIAAEKLAKLTCSSRTDAGVHALQNFFHFDCEESIPPSFLYNINAILPPDISIKNAYSVPPEANCRFDAVNRKYKYYVYRSKNPFIQDRAYYYPYALDVEKLSAAASLVTGYKDFTSFSKRNTQVKDFNCSILKSVWTQEDDCIIYEVQANRFLRGMVRGLVGTMLQIGRGKLELTDFERIIISRDCTQADFSVPGRGLFLTNVNFPDHLKAPL